MDTRLLTYSYYGMAGLSTLGGMSFIYYAILELVGRPYGGLVSGVVFTIQSVILIVVTPLTARRIDRIALRNRLQWSLLCQAILMGLALVPGALPPHTPGRYPLFVLCLGALAAFDLVVSQLRMAAPLEFDRRGLLPLMKGSALSSLASRGMLMIAPLVAHALPRNQWLFAAALNSVSYAGGIVASLVAQHVLGHHEQPSQGTSPAGQPPSIPYATVAVQRALARWSYAFFFLINLALGSVSFLLIALGKLVGHHTDIPPFTALYGGMTAALVVVFFTPSRWLRTEMMTVRITTYLLYLQSALLLGIAGHVLRGTVWFMIFGLLYGVTLLSLAEVVTKRLQGATFVAYMGKGQSAGRVGAVFATLAVGHLIDIHWSPWHVLAWCGAAGLCCTLFLHIYGRKMAVLDWTPSRAPSTSPTSVP